MYRCISCFVSMCTLCAGTFIMRMKTCSLVCKLSSQDHMYRLMIELKVSMAETDSDAEAWKALAQG
jgi:hypothetical protein